MCVTLHDASLGLTMAAGWRDTRLRVHCLAYGNEPENRAPGANIMILHIPVATGTTLTKQNFVRTDGLRHILDDMWAAAPKRQVRATRDEPKRMVMAAGIDVFDMGAYTWVAATAADEDVITSVLGNVRPDRRPQITGKLRDLIADYRDTWPYDALAIACFDTSRGEPTEPAVIQYVPQDWDILRIPAVDAHGTRFRFGVPVRVNHRVIVGTDEFGLGGLVRYREEARMDARLALTLPGLVVGAELSDTFLPQGDFYVDFGQFRRDNQVAELYRAHGPALTSQADVIPMLLG